MKPRLPVVRSLMLLAATAVLPAAASAAAAAAAAPAAGPLDWPAITSQTKPWSRWWWLASIGTDRDFTVEMEKYAQAGLGGLEITPIYGVRGEEKRFVNYLSPEWVRRLEYVLHEGKRLNLGIDMANGNGWPFGGPNVGDEDSARYVAHKIWKVAPGAKLTEPVVFVQEPIVHVASPRQVSIKELKDPVSSNPNQQELSLDQVRFEKKIPLQALMAFSDKGEKVNLTSKVAANGTLDWTAPAGANWTLYGVFMGWHGKQVERAGPGGEGNAIDHFSSSAFKHYISRFDQAFAGHDVSGLRAYFSDSYELDDSAGESDWTPKFFDEFQKRRGYDLRDELPAFFGQDTPEKNARVISDHRETVSDLMYDEYMASWREWAAGRGAMIRDQAHGSPANVLDLYAAASIPETEGADPLRMKFASSAAHVTGKPLASAETNTWLGEHYSSTLGDAKARVDATFLGGINHVFYHGTASSPENEPWPGHHFYAAVEFDPSNAFWPDFPILNNYVAHVQSFLQSTKPANDVLLYYPIYDRWAVRGDGAMPHFGGPQGTTAQDDGQQMMNRGYTFDFISDRLLMGVTYAKDRLQAGGNPYRVVVVPETTLMPAETLRKLVDLVSNGATVIIHKHLPTDVPGFGNLDARRADLKGMTDRITRADPDHTGVHAIALGKGRFLLGDNLDDLLARAAVQREALVDQHLSFERRATDSGFVYFLANRGTTSFAGWLPMPRLVQAAALFEPMTGQHGVAALRKGAQGLPEVYVQIGAGDSTLLKTFTTIMAAKEAAAGAPYAYWTPGEAKPLAGNWSVRFMTGGPALPTAATVTDLKSWTDFAGDAGKAFSGTAAYTLTFAQPAGDAAAWQIDLGKVAESARIRLNGVEIAALIKPPFVATIPASQLKAQNTLEVLVTNLSANRIADLDRRDPSWKHFYNANMPARIASNRGPDGMFSAAKWTPRPSGLLGPVTLAPLSATKL